MGASISGFRVTSFDECCNPSLVFVAKVRACKGAGQKSPKSHISCSQEVESMGECENWTSTLPSELPPWELESPWTFESSESDCKGENPSDWKIIYIILKILEHRCLKWACMTHSNIWNTSYGQMKGRESNRQFDSRTLKVGNRLDFLTCMWCVTYFWKVLDEGYNFVVDLISIGGLHRKLRTPKVGTSCRSPNFGNFETPTWQSWDKMPFGCRSYGHAQSIL
jgi:hypothetical protein